MKLFRIAALAACLAIAPLAFAASVNINKADATALEQLEGIGPVKAEAIIAYREANGAFADKAQLTEVDGIGDATLDAIRDDIALK